MNRFWKLSGLLVVSLSLIATSFADNTDELDRIDRMIRNSNWEKAGKAIEKILHQDPDNGRAWHSLSLVRIQQGDNKGAFEAATKSSNYPRFKASSLYNLACFHAMKGEKEQAWAVLQKALAAGWQDYDHMQGDNDLKSIRDRISFPRKHEYRSLKHGSVTLQYRVVLPKNYNAKKTYPAMVLMPSGRQQQGAMDWAISNLLGESAENSDWIVLCPLAPSTSWYTHPAHHALNAVMDHVRDEYKIGGKYHLVGWGSGGAPANTYSNMSRSYFQSLTILSSYTWSYSDDRNISRIKMPVNLIVGAKDAYGVKLYKQTKKRMDSEKVKASLTILPDDAYVLNSLMGAKFFQQMNRLTGNGPSS